MNNVYKHTLTRNNKHDAVHAVAAEQGAMDLWSLLSKSNHFAFPTFALEVITETRQFEIEKQKQKLCTTLYSPASSPLASHF